MTNRDASPRLASLDIFRGLTIAAMIVVNNPGSAREGAFFAPLRHAEWHGCTLADLVFPFFIFVVGVSAVFSLDKRRAGSPLFAIYRHIFGRALKIFFLGLATWFICGWLLQALCPPVATDQPFWSCFFSPPGAGGPSLFSLANLRIPGVLQRLALVYLVVALLVLHRGWRLQAAAAGALLLTYWGLMTLTGFNLEAGQDLSSFIDRAVFGPAHLLARDWDPEGLLSTLPAIATGLMGALTGHWLKSARDGRRKVLGLWLAGGLALGAGWLWALIFPLNKQLWTSSFVLYSSGYALLLLGAVYWLIDLKRLKALWTQPFLWLGTKALLAYCLSQIGFMALYHLYIGTPAAHTNLLTAIQQALFGENWDVLGLSNWRDPRWPSLFWALTCLTFWTLTVRLVQSRLSLIQVLRKPATTRRPKPAAPINFWDADHLPAGYLGG
jgi:predicted acyltransferase